MDMKAIVISLGGSLLFKEGKFDREHAAGLAKVFMEIAAKGQKLAIITGGGMRAREYANAARKKYGSEFFADREAIKATRENAMEMIKLIGKASYGKAMMAFDDIDAAFKTHNIALGGGMLEGLTTDAVSVLFAEKLGARCVVNLGDTDGIYTADPKKDRNAKRLEIMTHGELVDLAVKNDSRRAGTHFVFDLVAAKLAARSNIELRFVNGKDLISLKGAISGNHFDGTRVRD
ncbi:MAG: UMP kinase [Candidatus Micrarchaeota archaeon]